MPFAPAAGTHQFRYESLKMFKFVLRPSHATDVLLFIVRQGLQNSLFLKLVLLGQHRFFSSCCEPQHASVLSIESDGPPKAGSADASTHERASTTILWPIVHYHPGDINVDVPCRLTSSHGAGWAAGSPW